MSKYEVILSWSKENDAPRSLAIQFLSRLDGGWFLPEIALVGTRGQCLDRRRSEKSPRQP